MKLSSVKVTEYAAQAGRILSGIGRISLFSEILKGEAETAYIETLRAIASEDRIQASVRYGRLFKLVSAAWSGGADGPVDAWQAYLAGRVLRDENPFTIASERYSFPELPQPLREQAAVDLSILRMMFVFTGNILADAVAAPGGQKVISFAGIRPKCPSDVARFACLASWTSSGLAKAISSSGAGLFGEYHAFRWSGRTHGLTAVPHPDPIRLNELFLYEWQKEALVKNTKKLLKGFRANNALLWGDRGTGKSSTVKAIANEFTEDGLRLIEVSKEHLEDFPEILRLARNRALKFILFIDDLSFEEDDSQFKALKAVLEGGVESRPANVVIYATSNRRNLVRERFIDRPDPALDEVMPMDSMQEKLSLADRFGLRLPYMAPDQEEYLEIVFDICRREGVKSPRDIVASQALQWRDGRSGRAARQFVDWFKGEEELNKSN